MIEWHEIEDEKPEAGSMIIAELEGCKAGKYFWLTVREGEGFGHIKRWSYVDGSLL